MNSFLYRVAAIYFSHHKHDLNSFTFVFPNRRAGLFFQRYLSEIADVPLFSPEIITIESCFIEASGLEVADKLSMLFRLYRIFCSNTKSEENFDTFVSWGETLLSDFNEVDKYSVDARQLFRNITDLKEIDIDFQDFSENQIEAIRLFWQNFEPFSRNKSKEHFITTWQVLYPVYEQFRRELADENTGYEGMIARDVTDRLKKGENMPWFDARKFVFIGFNALNPCEEALMSILQKRNQADFYWDYEANELRDSDNPASLFHKTNTRRFKSRYEIEPLTELLKDKSIELIALPSAIGQAKHTYQILQQLYPDENNDSYLKTALVLPDENLLLPALYSIPDHIRKINVTMGYPMQLTPVAGLIDHIFELHKRKRTIDGVTRFYHLTVSNILNHQLITCICGDVMSSLNDEIIKNNLIYIEETLLHKNDLLKNIFNADVNVEMLPGYLLVILNHLQKSWFKEKDKSSDFQLESGFLYQYYTTINRISGILKTQASGLEMQMDTLIRLIKQLTQGISIPFVGEPLDGLQVIGALETRGLDFENIIICSFNEGVYPKKSFSNSFIPYHLRKGFLLPTYEHQDAITSYNFYRLIHRAKKIFLLYDSRIDNGNTGEVSRFYHQLKYHYNINIEEKNIVYDVRFKTPETILIEKNERVQEKFKPFFAKTDDRIALSASSINTYIKCPLQFYFSYIEEIKPVEEISERLESSVFGSIFHEVMFHLYEPYTGSTITAEAIEMLLKDDNHIQKLINMAFATHYFKQPKGTTVELQGNNLLISTVVMKMIKGVLEYDKKQTPFDYIKGEKRCDTELPVKFGNVNIKGFIDRVDSKDGVIRIFDYKTGGGSLEFKSWDDLFEHDRGPESQSPHVLQTFLYGFLYKKHTSSGVLRPGIIYTKKIFKDEFSTQITYKPTKNEIEIVDNYYDHEEEFLTHLKSCVEEIFNPAIPFVQTKSTGSCQYCDFKIICKR